MPKRKQDIKSNANLTLVQTLNWIAFDNTDGPELSPAEIQLQFTGDIETLEEADYRYGARQILLKDAEIGLYAALRDGDIQARGRFSNQRTQKSSKTEWSEFSYEGHSSERSDIPAEFWRLEGVDWDSNLVRSPGGEFADIILSRENVFALWVLEEFDGEEETEVNDGPAANESSQKRGPKSRYDEKEFLEFCFWEVATNDLPEKSQAEFANRMEELIAVLWGEDNVPGPTWLKERISQIFKRQEMYEKARQQVLKK